MQMTFPGLRLGICKMDLTLTWCSKFNLHAFGIHAHEFIRRHGFLKAEDSRIIYSVSVWYVSLVHKFEKSLHGHSHLGTKPCIHTKSKWAADYFQHMMDCCSAFFFEFDRWIQIRMEIQAWAASKEQRIQLSGFGLWRYESYLWYNWWSPKNDQHKLFQFTISRDFPPII